MGARLTAVFLVAVGSASAMFGLAPQAASPAAGGGLGELGIAVEPARGLLPSPWLVYEIDPGGSVSDVVTVRNDSAEPRSLDLYAADARIAASGAYEADLKGVQERTVGAWTRLDVSRLDLAPHSSRQVNLALTVPRGTDPGEYNGSVLAQFETAGQGVHLVHRIGLRVYLTVKGALVERGRVVSFTSGHWWQRGWPTDPVVFQVGFKNTGTVHLKLTGSISTDAHRLRLAAGGGYALVSPGMAQNLLTSWDAHPWIGVQRAQVDITYANHGTGHAQAVTEVWVIPWKLLLIAASVAVLLGYLVWRTVAWLRRRRIAVTVDGVSMRMTLVNPRDHPASLPAIRPPLRPVMVALQVTNGGPRPFRFDPGAFSLVDAHNRSHPAEPPPPDGLGEVPGEGEVEPGGRQVFAVLFALPEGVQARAGTYRTASGRLIAEAVAWR